MVYEHLDSLPEVERTRAKCYMEKLDKESLFQVGCSYEKLDENESKSWIANAVKQLNEGVFNAVIFEEGRTPSIEDVWNDDSLLVRSRDIKIPANAAAYSEVACRLIQGSNEIVLVDPYFTLTRKKNSNVLAAFIKIAQASNRCESIKIISLNDPHRGHKETMMSDAYLQKESKKILADIGTKDVNILWKLVSDDGAKIRFADKDTNFPMHPRYLVSLRGGLRFDKGFEEFDSQVVDISTLDKDQREENFNLYAENAAGFKTVREVRWNGNSVSFSPAI